MCEKPEDSSSGRGMEMVAATPFVVVGAAVALTLIVRAVQFLAPLAVAGGAGYVAFRAGMWLRRLRERRRVARAVPAPDYQAFIDAPVRHETVLGGWVQNEVTGTRRALPGTTKAPAPVRDGRRSGRIG